MTTKLVSRKELRSVFGIPYCHQHIARLEKAGEFPKRVQLGLCRVAWVAEEVEEWIAERVALYAGVFHQSCGWVRSHAEAFDATSAVDRP